MNDEVYEPSDDTELLVSLVEVKRGELALEVGSGSGVISAYLAKRGAKVIATDINPWAAVATKKTLAESNVDAEVLNCDLATCIREMQFDLAVFNPPYLPYEERKRWIDFAWNGGRTGIEEIVRFLSMVRATRYYFVYSSLSDFDSLHDFLKMNRFVITRSKEKTIGYETITAVEVKPLDKAGHSGA